MPPLVKQNLGLLHTIVLNARDQKLVTVQPEEGGSEGGKTGQEVLVDVLENPLESPLDLAHFSELGKLETVLTKQMVIPHSSLVKKKPDLSVFGKGRVSKESKAWQFVSPYQRFALLKPYLDSLNANDDKKEEVDGLAGVPVVRTEMENIRIQSIKKVFDELTEATPKRVEKKYVEEEEEEEAVAEDGSEEDEPEPYFKEDQPYKHATEKLKPLRSGAQQKEKRGGGKRGGRGGGEEEEEEQGGGGEEGRGRGRGAPRGGSRSPRGRGAGTPRGGAGTPRGGAGSKTPRGGGAGIREALKRKSEEGGAGPEDSSPAPKVPKTEFDYNNVDYSKFGKKEQVEGGKKQNLNKSDGARQKQRFKKSGSKSGTFKR